MRRQQPAGGLLTGPRRAAVLGSPVRHSLSPALHRAAYRALGLDWSYEAVEADQASLPRFLAGLDAAWAGLSLTMPLKRAVLPFLDTVDDVVRATGSCNTVVLAGGARHGHNTDVEGIVAAVAALGPPPPGPGVVLGGGATAASAVVALTRLGSDPLVVLARDPDRAAEVLAAARDTLDRPVRVDRLDEAAAAAALAPAGIAVSTLPAGAADGLAAAVTTAAPASVLLDVVYDPWPTALAAAWEAAGARVVAGAEMLLHQAAAQVRLMTGCRPPVAAMRAGMTAERRRRLTLPG
ncbi:MAG: shikimate dehydrogenase [Kineosporiaceae bacterium]